MNGYAMKAEMIEATKHHVEEQARIWMVHSQMKITGVRNEIGTTYTVESYLPPDAQETVDAIEELKKMIIRGIADRYDDKLSGLAELIRRS